MRISKSLMNQFLWLKFSNQAISWPNPITPFLHEIIQQFTHKSPRRRPSARILFEKITDNIQDVRNYQIQRTHKVIHKDMVRSINSIGQGIRKIFKIRRIKSTPSSGTFLKKIVQVVYVEVFTNMSITSKNITAISTRRSHPVYVISILGNNPLRFSRFSVGFGVWSGGTSASSCEISLSRPVFHL